MMAAEKESAFAKLDPVTRAEITAEVVRAIQKHLDGGFWETAMNDVSRFRKLAEVLDVPFLVLRFALEGATDVPEENWSVTRSDALQYAKWVEQHGKGAE